MIAFETVLDGAGEPQMRVWLSGTTPVPLDQFGSPTSGWVYNGSSTSAGDASSTSSGRVTSSRTPGGKAASGSASMPIESRSRSAATAAAWYPRQWVMLPTPLGASKLNIVVLADSSVTDTAPIERLRQAGQLGAGGLVLLGDILGTPAADIEDLFEPAFYLELVNAAYAGLPAGKKLTVRELPADARLVCRVERAFEKRKLNNGRINHYAPRKHSCAQQTHSPTRSTT